MDRMVWLLCPVCGNKTRLKVRQDTELINFPLYYPKCKQETLVNFKKTTLSVIRMIEGTRAKSIFVNGSVYEFYMAQIL